MKRVSDKLMPFAWGRTAFAAALVSLFVSGCLDLSVEKRGAITGGSSSSSTGGTNGSTATTGGTNGSTTTTGGTNSSTTSATTTTTTTTSGGTSSSSTCGNTGDTTTALVTGNTTPATTGKTDVAYSYTPTSVAAGVTFTVRNAPVWATFNTTTGSLTGFPDVAAAYTCIQVVAKKGPDQQTIGPFTITVAGDPLLANAWEFQNTGQTTFSPLAGVVGVDARIRAANRLGYFGSGVRVAISDSGVQIAHEDLVANVGTGSRDYSPGMSAPYTGTPTASTTDAEGAHGTSVAGIIAGVGWNGKGSRGVAPLASIVGFNYVSYQSFAHLVDQITDTAAVFNQSWGSPASAYSAINSSYLSAVVSTVTGNRSGAGAVLVRAAGNEWAHPNPPTPAIDVYDTHYSAPLACTTDGLNSHPYQMVIAASDSQGVAASYSSPGSAIWITAPGGEFGYDIGFGSNDYTASAATISTDLMGCAQGGSTSSTNVTAFQSGGTGNTGCNYTALFNGTSSATPHVAGTVALMLEANPSLTWRDVKHILAKTASQIDAGSGDYVVTAANGCPISGSHFTHCDPPGHINMPGWRTNGAGYKFHYWYGFGELDAAAAVNLAKTYTAGALGAFHQTGWTGATAADSGTTDLNLSIPDFDSTGITSTVTETASYTIEAVQVALFITHAYMGDVGIEIISPHGTRSVILHTNNGMGDSQNLGTAASLTNADPSVGGAIMLTNAFYGENSAGTWTINVLDGYGMHSGYGVNITGKLNRWALNISGHTPLTPEP